MPRKAVKTKKKSPKSLKKQSIFDKFPKSEKEHLELQLFFTERANKSHPQKWLTDQADRIKAKIAVCLN